MPNERRDTTIPRGQCCTTQTWTTTGQDGLEIGRIMQGGLMIAANFRGGADWTKQVRTQFHMWGCPYEQIAWRRRVTLPEAAAMLEIKRFAGRPIHGGIETLFDLLECRLVCPAWYDTTSPVCRVDKHPATTVKDGKGTFQVNLVAFGGQQARLPQ